MDSYFWFWLSIKSQNHWLIWFLRLTFRWKKWDFDFPGTIGVIYLTYHIPLIQAHNGGIEPLTTTHCDCLLAVYIFMTGDLTPLHLRCLPYYIPTWQLLLDKQIDRYLYIFCLFPERIQTFCNKTHVRQSNQILIRKRSDHVKKMKRFLCKGYGLRWDHLSTRLISELRQKINTWLTILFS